jgi:hypothetical protein
MLEKSNLGVNTFENIARISNKIKQKYFRYVVIDSMKYNSLLFKGRNRTNHSDITDEMYWK